MLRAPARSARRLALLAGALSISPQHSLFVLAALFAFAICSKMTSLIIKDRVRTLPVVVFLAMAVTRCGFVYAEYGTVSGYHYIMAFVEAGLSFILTLIFLRHNGPISVQPACLEKKRLSNL